MNGAFLRNKRPTAFYEITNEITTKLLLRVFILKQRHGSIGKFKRLVKRNTQTADGAQISRVRVSLRCRGEEVSEKKEVDSNEAREQLTECTSFLRFPFSLSLSVSRLFALSRSLSIHPRWKAWWPAFNLLRSPLFWSWILKSGNHYLPLELSHFTTTHAPLSLPSFLSPPSPPTREVVRSLTQTLPDNLPSIRSTFFPCFFFLISSTPFGSFNFPLNGATFYFLASRKGCLACLTIDLVCLRSNDPPGSE